MPRLNGKHVSMAEFERWEYERDNPIEAVPDDGLVRRIRAEYVAMCRARKVVVSVTELAHGEGHYVDKLVELYGFDQTVRALKAVSPKAKMLFAKYGRKKR